MADALQAEREQQADAVESEQRCEAEQHQPGPGLNAAAQQGQAHQQRHGRESQVRRAARKVDAQQVRQQQQGQQR